MIPIDANPNIATVTILVIGALVIISIVWLFIYFFGGRDPLRWNAEARVEAAQNPANLLNADREFRRQRNILRLLALIIVVLVFVQLAPTQSRAVGDALLVLFGEVFRVLREQISTFMASRGA